MNQSAAKASKRELRRAFGPSAVETIAEHAAKIAQTANDFYTFRQSVALELLALQTRCDTEAAARQKLDDWRSLPLWGRLRWLVRGQ